MRPYRNITDEELFSLGALREWNSDIAKALPQNSELLWVHNRRKKFTSIAQHDDRLVRRVNIVKIDQYDITTNFGRYSLENGNNVHDACGCKRFCDCYGRLYLLASQQH